MAATIAVIDVTRQLPSPEMLFRDREEAGRKLAARLEATGMGDGRSLVLALPRGGLPVAAPVAEAMGAQLDILVVRKLGMPGHPELAMGAVASGGVRVLNEEIVRSFDIDPSVIEQIAAREREELTRREELYRNGRPPPDVEGRSVILVDDGLATGATMRVAVEALKERGAGHIAVAVPLAAPDVCRAVGELVDSAICLETPQPFSAVGRWYGDFPQVSDEEVRELLASGR